MHEPRGVRFFLFFFPFPSPFLFPLTPPPFFWTIWLVFDDNINNDRFRGASLVRLPPM